MTRIGGAGGASAPAELPSDEAAPVAATAASPAIARGRDPHTACLHGRTVTGPDGTVIRDEAWRVKKQDHVDRIHRFAEQHPSTGMRYLSLLSDINFSRGVYAEAEVMSLINDYLAPTDASGKPASAAWEAYIGAANRGASDVELTRLFFVAHNEALVRALEDPAYRAAHASASPKLCTLCDVTLKMAEDMERDLKAPGADASLIMMDGIRKFLQAHVEAGVLPLRPGDLDLVMRASNMNPLERLMDKMTGESSDEILMARAMRTVSIIFEGHLRSRLDNVNRFVRNLLDRWR